MTPARKSKNKAPGLTPGAFFKQFLKKGNIPPVLLWSGLEDYWKELHFQNLTQQILGESPDSLNVIRFKIERDVEEVIEEAQSLGFFNSHKVITYGDVAGLNADDQKILLDYIDNPNPSTVLILNTVKLDGRSPLARHAPLQQAHVQYQIGSTKDIQDFIHYKLKELPGVQISQPLMNHLLDLYPENLRALSHAVDKAAASANYEGNLEMHHYAPGGEGQPQFEPFVFTDAVLEKKPERALRLAEPLLRGNESLFGAIGLLRSQLAKCLILKELTRKTTDPSELAAAVPMPPFVVRRMLPRIQHTSAKDLRARYQLLAACDQRLKSSPTAPRELFTHLIMRLCQ